MENKKNNIYCLDISDMQHLEMLDGMDLTKYDRVNFKDMEQYRQFMEQYPDLKFRQVQIGDKTYPQKLSSDTAEEIPDQAKAELRSFEAEADEEIPAEILRAIIEYDGDYSAADRWELDVKTTIIEDTTRARNAMSDDDNRSTDRVPEKAATARPPSRENTR